MTEVSTRKRVWGWMFFDWASQPYNTLLITFIFAPYFTSAVVGDSVQGQAVWGYTVGIAGVIIAIFAPILGAWSDTTGSRRPWIALFSLMYVFGSFLLWWAVPGMQNYIWILVVFGIGLIGMEFATIFTNAYLPELGPREEVGKLSGNGWALGYVGGLITLVIMLALLAENSKGVTLIGIPPIFGLDAAAREGTRAVGPLTAIWYAIFIIPFFLWVKDMPRKTTAKGALGTGLKQLKKTLANLPKHPSLFAFLGASMLYRDALNGIYTFGGIYAKGVLGWSVVSIGVFGILAITSGALFAWLGGKADHKYGPKPVILVSIFTLVAVVFVIVMLDRNSVLGFAVAPGSSLPDIVFYACGFVIGAAGGTIQSASRTMLVRQADPDRMTEAFGLYALSGKATAFLAPIAIAITTQVTQSQRLGVTPVIVLFVLGLILLTWVKPEGEKS
ncbi:MAG: MFS transporter [Alphaproteobacteria bacterium]|nr:MFS transporter [Alphaproteobacteria bacterium]